MADSKDNNSVRENTRSGSPRKRQLKLVAIIIAAVVIVIWLAFWLYHRFTHVSENDARVTSHEITVSSRLPGRVTGFDLIEGDKLAQGDKIAQLYSTPDKLELEQLNAQIANIQAQLRLARQQIAGGVKSAKAMLAARTRPP